MKRTLLPLLLLCSLYACNSESPNASPPPSDDTLIDIEYPEVYELANIILALTDYGKTDKWEVRKDFPYYEEVMEYFAPVEDHPLLDSASYSRKRWKEYLSFRTDAYAFQFDEKGTLHRQNEFYAFPPVQAFDKHLALIEDFARQSKYREFYQSHQAFYQQMIKNCREEAMLDLMQDFLVEEYGNFLADQQYIIVISPFVYAQQLQREIDSLTTCNFPAVADAVAAGGVSTAIDDRVKDLLSVFTEMDHAYVNPTTERYGKEVAEKFDGALWRTEKAGYESGNATFDEYMTWATFSVFVASKFPEQAQELHYILDNTMYNRGFPYFYPFAQQLLELYAQKQPSQGLKDLYPALLNWTAQVQPALSRPMIRTPEDSLLIAFTPQTPVDITFTEALTPSDRFMALIEDNKSVLDTLYIDAEEHQLRWMEGNKGFSLNIPLPADRKQLYLTFNWGGVHPALNGENGMTLRSNSYIRLVNSEQ
ncbi:MAG: DUF4932 domain-containing protein [Bacteroidota bacterium]